MAIRTTQNQFFTLLNSNLQTNYYKLASLQEQIASGKKLQRPSDDPVGQSLSLTLRGGKADIERYKPQEVELDTPLRCFIPEYIPAIGELDAFIKVCPRCARCEGGIV